MSDPQVRVREVLRSRRLRPLGNRLRLACTPSDTYDVRLLLFADRASAKTYYDALKRNTLTTPPPCLVEILLAHIPRTIFDEKYAVVMPNERADSRPAYREWALSSIRKTNETLRIHNSTDHKYKEISQYMGEVFEWDVLCPQGFDLGSREAQELLTDPTDGGWNAVNYVDPDAPAAETPEPHGPWIGVLLSQAEFKDPLDATTGTRLLLKKAGVQNFAGAMIHGSNVERDGRFWCVAVHTASDEQAQAIGRRVRDLHDNEYCSFVTPTLAREPGLPLSRMPPAGHVTADLRFESSR